MSPEQELFDYFFAKCLELTDQVYDWLPPEDQAGLKYPFIHVGQVSTVSEGTKLSMGGQYDIVISAWGTLKNRLEVVELAQKIYRMAVGSFKTEHYRFFGAFNQQQKQILNDTSVPNIVFVRGMCTLRVHLNQ